MIKAIASLFLISTFPFYTFAKTSITVLIDAGHGGEDSGAKFDKIKEKDIALQVALELKKFLDDDSRFTPLMTRDRDAFIPLDERKKKAEDARVDIFLSIHANSSPVATARGTEFYFENQVPTDEESFLLANRENNDRQEGTEENGASKNADLSHILNDLAHNEHILMSQQLSQHMLEAFQSHLKVKTRAIRQAPFRVLGVSMPATLIELGFISNPSEAAWLNKKKTQHEIALAIYAGLKTFKGKLDKIKGAEGSSN